MNRGELIEVRDEIAIRLDDIADLCEHWKRNRERGRMPTAVRAALVMSCQELAGIVALSEGKTAAKGNEQ